MKLVGNPSIVVEAMRDIILAIVRFRVLRWVLSSRRRTPKDFDTCLCVLLWYGVILCLVITFMGVLLGGFWLLPRWALGALVLLGAIFPVGSYWIALRMWDERDGPLSAE